jgi:hypothetical protein
VTHHSDRLGFADATHQATMDTLVRLRRVSNRPNPCSQCRTISVGQARDPNSRSQLTMISVLAYTCTAANFL